MLSYNNSGLEVRRKYDILGTFRPNFVQHATARPLNSAHQPSSFNSPSFTNFSFS